MARPRVTAWAAVVVGIGFAGMEAIVLNARIRDYDEGVYWQSIRALARGEALFSSVFASQPPAFYYALLPFGAARHSLAGLRVSVLVLGVIGLAATYLVGRLLAGPVAGLVAVLLAATSPLYLHQSAIVQADGPAVAVSMLAVAFALLAARANGRSRDAIGRHRPDVCTGNRIQAPGRGHPRSACHRGALCQPRAQPTPGDRRRGRLRRLRRRAATGDRGTPG